jgi:redox-sensitive bicupin YhaK (pirin superfamily)
MRSPAQTDWPLVGLDVTCDGAVAFPLLPEFEYAVAVLEGSLRLGDAEVGTNELAYLGTGHDQLEVDPRGTSHFFLLGGEPFESELEMWWNFVARDRSEMDTAYREWQAGSDRFGSVATTLERIEAPRPLWLS